MYVAVELSYGVMSLGSHRMADCICMPYEVVSGVSRGMGVLDGSGYYCKWIPDRNVEEAHNGGYLAS